MDYALTNYTSKELQAIEELRTALVNEKKFLVNEEILDAFINSLRKKTQATKDSYLKGAKHFIKYCYDHNIEAVEEQDITDYLNYITTNYKPASVNVYVTSLRAFYNFLAKKGIKNLASDLHGEKIARNFKKDPLTKEQAKKLLSSIDRSTPTGKRDFAIINLLLRAGLRTIEVERANVGDLRTLGTKQLLNVQRKGHKEKDDFILLTDAIYEPIMDYLLTRKDLKPSDALFISYSDRTHGQGLTTRSIREIVKNRLRAIGINNPRITSHSLRHTAVTFSLLGGATLQEAQLLAGHENINTTLIYAHNLDKLNAGYETRVDDYLDN